MQGSNGGSAGQQLQHAADRAGDHRQVLQLGRLDRVRDLRLRRLNERGLAGNGQRLVDPCQCELEIDGERRVDIEPDVFTQRLRESGQFRFDLVSARFESWEEVLSFRVADCGTYNARGGVRNSDGHSGQNGVCLIDDTAVERARCLRIGHRRDRHQTHCDYRLAYTFLRHPHSLTSWGERITETPDKYMDEDARTCNTPPYQSV